MKRRNNGATDARLIGWLEHLKVVRRFRPDSVSAIDGLINTIGGQDER